MRFAHTNLVARNPDLLIAFYCDVLNCQRIGQTRNLRGTWLDQVTGLDQAQITGEHLLLPGHGDGGPTLEIFAYSPEFDSAPARVNQPGFGHIAFEVEDVEETFSRVKTAGGSAIGELVSTTYADGRVLTIVYASDPEGNIIELQSWT